MSKKVRVYLLFIRYGILLYVTPKKGGCKWRTGFMLV